MKRFIYQPVLLLVISWAWSGLAQQSEFTGSIGHAPEPYSAVLVFIADGTINLLEDFAGPDWPDFQRDTLDRSQDEIETDRQAALFFFKTQYGVDLTDPVYEGRAVFRSYMADPRIRYRATSITGRWVAREGAPVFDGGWEMVVTDPNGLELGGASQGVTAPPGGLARFGTFYVALGLQPFPAFKKPTVHFYKGREQTPLLINYQSPNVISPNARGDESFHYQLSSQSFGMGSAMGTLVKSEPEEHMITHQVRTVLTFDQP